MNVHVCAGGKHLFVFMNTVPRVCTRGCFHTHFMVILHALHCFDCENENELEGRYCIFTYLLTAHYCEE